MIKSNVSLPGIYAFMGFINYQKIPFKLRHFCQLVKMPAECNGALQVLEADKLDALLLNFFVDIFLTGQNKRLVL